MSFHRENVILPPKDFRSETFSLVIQIERPTLYEPGFRPHQVVFDKPGSFRTCPIEFEAAR